VEQIAKILFEGVIPKTQRDIKRYIVNRAKVAAEDVAKRFGYDEHTQKSIEASTCGAVSGALKKFGILKA